MTTTETPNRPRRTVETREFCAMMARMIKAHRRRVVTGDTEDLADLVRLRTELDEAIAQAARGLHDGTEDHPGRSWTEIAKVLGVTRQAARQKFGDQA